MYKHINIKTLFYNNKSHNFFYLTKKHFLNIFFT
jgi:hypothetical protein